MGQKGDAIFMRQEQRNGSDENDEVNTLYGLFKD